MPVLALWPLVWQEWRHHPVRHGAAVLAVALGVALAWSVHVINASALAEFSAAVRAANGEPDAVLRGPRDGLPETLLDTLAARAEVEVASPVVEVETYATLPPASPGAKRLPVKVIGLDVLTAGPLTPQSLPVPGDDADSQGLGALDPGRAFVNAAARERLGLRDGQALQLQTGSQWQTWQLAGSVAAAGTPLVVMDVAAAQSAFGLAGRLSRIDLRLAPGTDARALQAALAPVLPAGVEWVSAREAEQRLSHLSRAYRVNLTVLALVALFVGGFLVYSVVALSVAQRAPAFALLGVLGLTAAGRRTLVLVECALLGAAGSAAGIAAGTALAAAALRWLAGDLGGGYFPGIAPTLQLQPAAAAVFAGLGLACAVAGGWVPARRAEALSPAQALKGLGLDSAGALQAPSRSMRLGLALVGAGVLLAAGPPVAGLPLLAYVAVAALLCGGIALVPAAVHVWLAAWPRPSGALGLLALQRARLQRQAATSAVAGVVASLALSVALTVMVGSFREGVSRWLDQVLPADLYARTASSSALAEQAWLDEAFVARVAALPGVRRVEASRSRTLPWAPGQPAVTLVARPLADPAAALPLLEPARSAQTAHPGAFVSEAMVRLHGVQPGQVLRLPLGTAGLEVEVRGVFRDYARQFGTITVDRAAYVARTGDARVNDLALWLQPGAGAQDLQAVQQGLREAAPDPSMLEFATTEALRKLSLAIFDRSFAVTTYLQAVAIGIGLIGVAASLSAQVLARRKEFGLLAHLGLTRAQVLRLVALEMSAWMAAGVAVGTMLGLAVSVVLVHVVNPQSFNWTMDLVVPEARLAALAALVGLAGVGTAVLAARQAASQQAVLSVKEDW